MKFYTLVAYSK